MLKEIPKNKTLLSAFKSSDFSEIYMFFDYDGHDSLASDNKIARVLQFFNEETIFGRLFISYPMVESLKHYYANLDFKLLKVEANKNIRYKQLVDASAKNELKQIKKYSRLT